MARLPFLAMLKVSGKRTSSIGAHMQKKLRVARKRRGQYANQQVCIGIGCDLGGGAVKSAIDSHWPKLKITNDETKASVFVVQSLDKIPKSYSVGASLIGGAVMQAKTFTTKQGPVLQHLPFLKMRKSWFVTDGFRAEHPRIFAMIQACFKRPICKSKLVDLSGKDSLMTRAKARIANGRGTEFVWLVLKCEHAEFKPLKNCAT